MKKQNSVFRGFDPELFKFLKDLSKNNNLEWFKQNRSRYEEFLVEPARAYVSELAPLFNRLNPAIRTEPKFNKTLMRMNKDMRFAKGAPYREYFLIHFGRFKMDSEFFLYFDVNGYQIGLFINNTEDEGLYFKQNFERFSDKMKSAFSSYKLNKKFDLYELNKSPEIHTKKFDFNKHSHKLKDIKWFIFQKVNAPSEKSLFSDQFLVDSIKIFNALYPIYSFCISPDPMSELEKFEESLGIPL